MRLDDGDLLKTLHEGLFEQPLWSSFLDKLRTITRAQYATLIFRPMDEATPIELYSGERPSAHLSQLFTERFAHDPLPYRTMREGRVYDLDELIDPANPEQRTFRDELIEPWGGTKVRMVRVSEPGGVDVWLSCVGGRAMGAGVVPLLAALVPHLRIAMRTFIAMERERFRSAMNTDAIRRLNFGWLTLDARCRIVDMTPHLETLFQRSSVLRRGRYDRLTPASPAVDRELSALVKEFAQDPDARPRAINLSRDPLIDILVRPIQNRSVSSPAPPVAIVYISGDRISQADRCDQLVDLFGLLPSEARLAWSIAQGQSIAEAAADLGLSVETARNYSKKIYAKTGAGRQAELVRIILTSVLAMA